MGEAGRELPISRFAVLAHSRLSHPIDMGGSNPYY